MTPTRSSAASRPEDALVRSKSPEGVRRMFSDIAPTYDFLNHLLSGGVDLWWRRVAAKRLLTRETRRVLDVCAGTGDLSLALAARAKRLGIAPLLLAPDFTPAMTRLAREKFERAEGRGQKSEGRGQRAERRRPSEEGGGQTPEGVEGAGSDRGGVVRPRTMVADTLRLPFPESAFDLVTVAFGIRNVTDLRGGLNEMVRVTRSGGTVAVLEFSHPRTPAFRRAYEFYFHQILPRIGRALTGTGAYMYLPKSVASFPDTDEFASLLSELAGTRTEARRLTFGIATLYSAIVKK